jgi:hypothetical protein
VDSSELVGRERDATFTVGEIVLVVFFSVFLFMDVILFGA